MAVLSFSRSPAGASNSGSFMQKYPFKAPLTPFSKGGILISPFEKGGGEAMDICFIIPPHMLKEIARRGSSQQKQCAWESLTMSEQMRGQRLALSVISALGSTATGTRRRTIYDAGNGYTLPGRLVRSEGSAASKDKTVNEAYTGAGVTYDLFNKVFGRNSIDDRGMRLDSTVHYGKDYDNAFWNGQQMVYGDGDGELFNRFTIAIDVIGHELTHGVTQYEAGLE